MKLPFKRSLSAALAAALLAALFVAVLRKSPERPSLPSSDGFLAEVRSKLAIERVLDLESTQMRDDDREGRLSAARTFAESGDACGAALILYPLLKGGDADQAAAQYAALCARLGWLDEADAALKQLSHPPSGPVLQVANAYAGHGDAARAGTYLKLLESYPLNAEERLNGALIWLRARRYEQAAGWAGRALALHPGHPSALAVKARAELADGHPELAARTLTPVAPGVAEPPELQFRRALILIRGDRRELQTEGLAQLVALAGRRDAPASAAYEAGVALVKLGRSAEALAQFSRSLQNGYQPERSEERIAAILQSLGQVRAALRAGGQASLARRNLPAAERAFRKCLEGKSAEPNDYLNLARSLSSQGNPQGALAVLEQAQRAFPRSVDVALLRAGVLGRLERVSDQVAVLEAAAELDPERANEPLGELGKLLYESQQYDRAAQVLLRAVKSEPNDALAHLYLGLTYSKRPEEPERARDAVRHLLRAGGASPDYFFPWMNAGSVLQQLGHLPEAAACFRRAINGDSRWEGPYLSLAQVLQRQGRLTERSLVLRHYSRARLMEARRQQLENDSSAHPGDAEARYRIGDRLLLDGHPAEAYSELLITASLSPGTPRYQQRLADVCALLGYEEMQREAELASR